MNESVNKYAPRTYWPVNSALTFKNSLPLKSLIDIVSSDLILLDDIGRAVGLFYDPEHPRSRKGFGPEILFCIQDFSGFIEYSADLQQKIVVNHELTSLLYDAEQPPASAYEALAKIYKQILKCDRKGRLNKKHG